MKRIVAFCLSAILLFIGVCIQATASEDMSAPTITENASLEIDAKSAILMEAQTGTILYEQNAEEALPPASVTKIMTLLLVMEAIEQQKIGIDDMVTISQYAASMGGSQVFLEEGEQFTVSELLKCTVIASANDAAVALAEYVCGSESAFVSEMNQRSAELSMTSTHFENVTGLDDTTVNHVTSAKDIAIMSRKLIEYDIITKYSQTWMDTFRDGAFTLTNTNRLVRYYPGATGLKTGSTAKAQFCLSATAKRDGMTLIAVIMGSPSRDIRNSEAMRLLDFGFANYALYVSDTETMEPLKVLGGKKDNVLCEKSYFSCVIDKRQKANIKTTYEMPNQVKASIKQGDEIGKVTYSIGDKTIGVSPILARESVDKISFGDLFKKMLQTFTHPR